MTQPSLLGPRMTAQTWADAAPVLEAGGLSGCRRAGLWGAASWLLILASSACGRRARALPGASRTGCTLGPLVGAAQPADLGTGQGLLYRPSVVPVGGGGTMGGGGSPTHVRLEGRKTAGGTFAQKKPETRRM